MLRDVPQIFVIRHDLNDLDARQLAGVVPEEQFPEAVGVLANEDRDALRLRPADLARHPEAPGHLLDAALEAHAVRVQLRGVKHNPLIEDARFHVRVLLGGHDAAAVAEERLAERGDDAFAVRAVDQEDRLRFGDAGHGCRTISMGAEISYYVVQAR